MLYMMRYWVGIDFCIYLSMLKDNFSTYDQETPVAVAFLFFGVVMKHTHFI